MAAPDATVDDEQVTDALLAHYQHRRDDRSPNACATCPHRGFPCDSRRAAERTLAAAGRAPLTVAA